MSLPINYTTPIIGEAPTFLAMLEQVSQAAALSKPVIIIGERGTGKELIASRLHYLSPRWEQTLIKLNCAVLTESLLESELFGHEAGAFTGAMKGHVGRFERADDGTLFLDELATIPLRMQEKILRVIEYGEFERVGGSETLNVDVRIVGATNEDLPMLTHTGRFRRDLLDRLAFDVITVPPLRARPEDIRPLADHFAVNVSAELGRAFFPGFGPGALEQLMSYEWPGNVRELKNAIERSVYKSPDPEEPLTHLELNPFASPFRPRALPQRPRDNRPAPALPSPGPKQPAIREPDAPGLPMDLKAAIREFESTQIVRALEQTHANQRAAAQLLGLTYHQLRGAMRKHDLLTRYGRGRGRIAKADSARKPRPEDEPAS